MHEVISFKCDGCKGLVQSISQIRTCAFCEHEGCINCTRHKMLKKGLINIWIHIKNTSNYGRSCMEEFYRDCTDREIDPDL